MKPAITKAAKSRGPTCTIITQAFRAPGGRPHLPLYDSRRRPKASAIAVKPQSDLSVNSFLIMVPSFAATYATAGDELQAVGGHRPESPTAESAGLTQEESAVRLKTQKTAISRIENHAEDISSPRWTGKILLTCKTPSLILGLIKATSYQFNQFDNLFGKIEGFGFDPGFEQERSHMIEGSGVEIEEVPLGSNKMKQFAGLP